MGCLVESKEIPGRLIHWRMIMQSWIHSRKAFLLLAVFTVASAALFVGRIDGGQWVDVVKWAVPIYMAANVADGITDAVGSKKDS